MRSFLSFLLVVSSALPLDAQQRTYDAFADSTVWRGAGKGVGGALSNTNWELRAVAFAAGETHTPALVGLVAIRARNYSNLPLSLDNDAAYAAETVELILLAGNRRVRLVSGTRDPSAREVRSSSLGTQVKEHYRIALPAEARALLLATPEVQGRIDGAQFTWRASERSYRELVSLLKAAAPPPGGTRP